MVTRSFAMLLAIIVLAAIIIFAGPAACSKIRSMAAQARMDRSTMEGRGKAEGEALNTIGNSADRADATDKTVKEGSDAIRSAPGSNAPVDPRSRDAARRASCGMRSYRDTPECRQLLGTGSAIVVKASPAR